jgi:hypothetical protein
VPSADTTAGNEDVNHTVEDILAVVMNARTADEASQPLGDATDFDEDNCADEEPVPPPAAATISTRSRRAPQLSSRYKGTDWVCH